MKQLNSGIRKFRQISSVVWLIIFLFGAFCFNFLKEVIVFILTQLYKFFIQQNAAG